jgi:hypothetical protein
VMSDTEMELEAAGGPGKPEFKGKIKKTVPLFKNKKTMEQDE